MRESGNWGMRMRIDIVWPPQGDCTHATTQHTKHWMNSTEQQWLILLYCVYIHYTTTHFIDYTHFVVRPATAHMACDYTIYTAVQWGGLVLCVLLLLLWRSGLVIAIRTIRLRRQRWAVKRKRAACCSSDDVQLTRTHALRLKIVCSCVCLCMCGWCRAH